jgi:hypothetical protein
MNDPALLKMAEFCRVPALSLSCLCFGPVMVLPSDGFGLSALVC